MQDERLRERVRALMMDNKMEGYSRVLDAHYCYIAPSNERYQFQWFWDTCFHIFILCSLDEVELAERNLRSLLKMQEENGFVGHMIFWNQLLPHRIGDIIQGRPHWRSLRPHMSALIQPPLIAQALLRIYKKSGDRLFLYEMLRKIIRYHEWLRRHRDIDGDGLISIISPSESGIDWKPSFDEVMRVEDRRMPRQIFLSKLFWKYAANELSNFFHGYHVHGNKPKFLVKEVAFNTVYACDLRALSELCTEAKLPEQAQMYKKRAEQVGTSILDHMYDNRTAAFYDVNTRTKEKLRVLTAMSFLPLILPEVSDEIAHKMIEKHFDNEKEFLTPFPIPSVPLNDPAYYGKESFTLWRGPTWPVINWFLYHSLREKGFVSEAARLRLSLRTLIEKSGFREYYDPQTGEGYGAKNFTWSGLIIDMETEETKPVARYTSKKTAVTAQ